jgi:hypothetical protein
VSLRFQAMNVGDARTWDVSSSGKAKLTEARRYSLSLTTDLEDGQPCGRRLSLQHVRARRLLRSACSLSSSRPSSAARLSVCSSVPRAMSPGRPPRPRLRLDARQELVGRQKPHAGLRRAYAVSPLRVLRPADDAGVCPPLVRQNVVAERTSLPDLVDGAPRRDVIGLRSDHEHGTVMSARSSVWPSATYRLASARSFCR